MIIAFVACSNNYDDLSTEEEYAHETSDSELINDQGYTVSPINTSTSFDEIVNVWSDCLDIDFEVLILRLVTISMQIMKMFLKTILLVIKLTFNLYFQICAAQISY